MDGTRVQNLEKSAGIAGLAKGVGKYLGNVTGSTAKKLESAKGTSRMGDLNYKNAVKNKRITQGLTGAGVVGGAGAIGGVKAYNDSTPSQTDNGTIKQPDPLNKSAGNGGADHMHEKMMALLEKVADETYGADYVSPEELALLQQQQEQAQIPSHESMVDNLEGYVQNYDSPPEEEEEADDGMGAKSVSNAPAGENKTAHDELVDRLEKVAGPMDFLKNVSGHNVRKAENLSKRMALDPRTAQMPYDEYSRVHQKNQDLHNLALKKQKDARDVAKFGGIMVGIPAAAGGLGLVAENAAQKTQQSEDEALRNALSEALARQQQSAPAPVEEEQTAHDELVDRLEKVAGPINFIKNISGHNVRKAEGAVKDYALDPETAMLPYKQYIQGQKGLESEVAQALKDKNKAETIAFGTGAGALGLSALGGAAVLEGKQQAENEASSRREIAEQMAHLINNPPAPSPEMEEQVAHDDLMGKLEKAAALPGVQGVKKAVGTATEGVKKFVGDASGKNLAKKTKALDTYNNPETFKNNGAQVGVSKYRNALETMSKQKDTAKTDMDSARKKLKVGGVAAAGTAAAGAGVSALTNDKNQEKTASDETEDVMNGLFKEAADAISEYHIPQVKKYVDPMNKIAFN